MPSCLHAPLPHQALQIGRNSEERPSSGLYLFASRPRQNRTRGVCRLWRDAHTGSPYRLRPTTGCDLAMRAMSSSAPSRRTPKEYTGNPQISAWRMTRCLNMSFWANCHKSLTSTSARFLLLDRSLVRAIVVSSVHSERITSGALSRTEAQGWPAAIGVRSRSRRPASPSSRSAARFPPHRPPPRVPRKKT